MKILYLTEPREDYLQDQILYGLRQLHGADVVDYPKKEVMYKSSEGGDLYGRGFTLWRLLDDIEVDRSQIEARVRRGEFDRVIFGSVRRQRPMFWSFFRAGLLLGKSRGRFVFLDGQDGDRVFAATLPFGPYFKREFDRRTLRFVKPINFSIPAVKIRNRVPDKVQRFGRHVQCEEAYKLPEVKQHCGSGYLFDQESDYYQDLAQSYFGITMKKGGWECMRHYEIAANHCVPAFYRLSHKRDRCAPHGLKDMHNVVAFDSADELAAKLQTIEEQGLYPDLQANALTWVTERSCENLAARLLARTER